MQKSQENETTYVCKYILNFSKIDGFRNPLLKIDGFRRTHGTHANVATERYLDHQDPFRKLDGLLESVTNRVFHIETIYFEIAITTSLDI